MASKKTALRMRTASNTQSKKSRRVSSGSGSGEDKVAAVTNSICLVKSYIGTSTSSEQSRRVHSPDVPSPNTGQAETVTSGNEVEVPTQVADPFEDLPANQAPVQVPEGMLFMEEKKPRQRKSRTSETRGKITTAHKSVRTHAEPVPRKGYWSWDQGMSALETYGRATGFHFRIRSNVKVSNCTE
ncbi:hypothetical protein GN244_ATG14276 [Phytophthora infestans]|uniref:Uncharacterized protein n=1 Tax=Phytophthora infestans TaxID=4787 RepID=A0A833SNB6_PHYIN|nr:hypothetical protein GN244_ATG14276 [Phytophthora infestans]KAF4130050.1 hypothetical protein GN958_ATG20764 [Phytophthora infestans]